MNKGILASLAVIFLIASVVSSTCEQACKVCLPADHCECCPAHWGCTVDPNMNELIGEQYSPAPVSSRPPGSTSFALDAERIITAISTYHGPGNAPGTIGLLSESGTMYGPWQASGCPGLEGGADAHWIVYPKVQLPPGTYSIADSGQSTWSFAPVERTGLKGHCFVFALKETPPRVNHLPIAGALSAVTDENMSINIDVLAQCSDPDNDTLKVISASTPSHGTAALNPDWTITYTPAQAYCGLDSFTYTISDGQATATSETIISIDCTTVSINCWTVSVREIDDCIQGLADEAFKPPASEQKKAFTSKLNAIGKEIVNEKYHDAMNQLQNDVRVRTDGYLGGNPEDDWITDSNAQIQVCGMIDELIANLEIQSGPPRVYPG
jgi:hypothetical protein